MHMWHVMYVSMKCNWSWSLTVYWIFVAELLTFHHWPCKFRKFLIDLTVGVVKMITSDIKGPYKIDYQCSTEKHFQILVYLYILSLIRTFTIPKSISKNSTFFLNLSCPDSKIVPDSTEERYRGYWIKPKWEKIK